MTRDQVRALIRALPEVEEGFNMGSEFFKVNGKVLTRILSDGSLQLNNIHADEREMLIEAEPETFHSTPHFNDAKAMMARIDALSPAALRSFMVRRWREIVPKSWLNRPDAPQTLPRRDRTPSEFLISSRRQGEGLNQPVRDGLFRRKGDTGLSGLEPGCGNVAGMRRDGGRRQIEPALLTERRIARDDGLSDPEPRHLVLDDFLGVRQGARQLGAQSHQQGAKVFRRLGDIGVVIGGHVGRFLLA